MEIVLIWLMFAVLTAVAASRRGRSVAGWFLMGLLFSVFGLILVLLLGSVDKPQAAALGPSPDTHLKCPDCAELVLKEARVCKHCGCRLVPAG